MALTTHEKNQHDFKMDTTCILCTPYTRRWCISYILSIGNDTDIAYSKIAAIQERKAQNRNRVDGSVGCDIVGGRNYGITDKP